MAIGVFYKLYFTNTVPWLAQVVYHTAIRIVEQRKFHILFLTGKDKAFF